MVVLRTLRHAFSRVTILFAVARDDLHANRFGGDSRDSHRNRVVDDAIP